jgi:hypothetical protein
MNALGGRPENEDSLLGCTAEEATTERADASAKGESRLAMLCL